MDPINLNRLGHIRQQEILEFTAQSRHGAPMPRITQRLGALFITVGQRMMAATEPISSEQPLASTINMENC